MTLSDLITAVEDRFHVQQPPYRGTDKGIVFTVPDGRITAERQKVKAAADQAELDAYVAGLAVQA